MNKLAGAALVLIALIASTVFPLLTYSVTLAVFGLAHVAVEMRYVESRFVDRLLGPMLTGVGALLAVIIVLRCIKMTGWVSRSQLLTCELVFIAIIASSVLLRWGRQSGVAGVVSGAVAGAIGLGIVLSPVTTMLVLACLHNWTPVGFIAEATTGARRRRWMMVCGLVFIAIPLLIASGVIQHLLAPWLSPDFTVLPTGPLKRNMGAFLPAVWHKAEWAPRVFSAVVFAQCMHYLTVLGALPRLIDTQTRRWLTAIPRPVYAAAIALCTLIFLVLYTQDFRQTKRMYSIAAAVHAWIELPVLMLALRPRSKEVAA